MCEVFATLLLFCEISDPLKLWESSSEFLCGNILFQKQKFFNHPNLILTQQQIHSYCLVEIEKILNRLGKSIEDFEGIPLPDFEDIKHLDNRIIREELNYNAKTLKTEFDLSNSLLNSEQRQVLDLILHVFILI